MPQPAPDAPTLCWSTGRSRTTANWSRIHDRSWSSFVHWLNPDKPAASKEVRPYVGGTLEHGRRSIRTVEQRFFLTLDADYADVDFPLDVEDVLEGVPYVIHTTWRHTTEAHRYRLVIPLSRGVEPNEYKELSWTVMNRLDGKRFDVTTAQAERFMWSPSSADPATYYWESANAQAPYLPVDEWLDGLHGPSDAPAARGQANPPPTPPATGSEAHTPPAATAEDKERALEILAQACYQVEHVYESEEFAGRNEAVFHLMPLLFRFCKAGALDEDLVKEALWESAQKVQADEPYERTEFYASVRSARQYAEETGPALPETTPTKMAQDDFKDVEPEVDLWTLTPRLRHVKQAADKMGRNPFALLACLLTRILAEAPAGIYLPGSEDGAIGNRAALNLGVALVGTSGQGKTSIIRNSASLLGPRDTIEGHPSTGQGLIQTYLRPDEDGNNVLIDDPRAFFFEDEIEKLGALGVDTGSTLFGEIRTMLTGGSTGTNNATRERQRTLNAGSYNFQLVLGVQPSKAGVLLDGQDAGTPQRFIWAQVTAPDEALRSRDRPPWPGQLEWDDSFFMPLEVLDPIVTYPDWILEELEEHDYKVAQEGLQGGELSRFGHQNLLRLKVAAGVAFLHESIVIEDPHVEIADIILAASKKTQMECEQIVRKIAFEKKKAAKHTDERVTEEIREDKLTKLVGNARGHLLRADGEWVGWHKGLRPAARDRTEYGDSVWEAIAEMEDVECEEEKRGQVLHRKARIVNERT
jgi:hypothetical protein